MGLELSSCDDGVEELGAFAYLSLFVFAARVVGGDGLVMMDDGWMIIREMPDS